MTAISRRRFLQGTAAAAAAIGLPACASTSNRIESGGKIRVAILGVRQQGRKHLSAFLRHPEVSVVALCDPDSAILMQAARLASRHGASVEILQDPLACIERPDLEAISIATPDHWHALLTVKACAAGKHVFVETPVSHGIDEGRLMVQAAREHGSVVQSGLPARAHGAIQEAMQFVREGNLGHVRFAHAICYRYRPSIGTVRGDGVVPPHIDYDVWTGPAPLLPLHRRKLHGDWRFDWNTGNGELGESGSELLDLARWSLCGQSATDLLPDRIWTCGGRFGAGDDGQTPNTLLAMLDFDGSPLLFEQRNLPARYGAGTRMDQFRGIEHGLIVQGDDHHLLIDPARSMCAVFDAGQNLVRQFHGASDPIANFVDAMRQRAELLADIEIGRGASELCHLVNLAHRTAAPANRVDVLRSLMSDSKLMARFDDMDTHVSRNGFDLDHELPSLSGWQRLHPTTGEFVDNPQANALRCRTYREPYFLGERPPAARSRKFG